MRWLAVAMLLAGGAAAADAGCFDLAGRAPRAITFDGGSVVRDIRRDGDVITYETRHPEIGAVRTTAHAGVFPLGATTRHGTSRHVWSAALPPRAALVPGARFERSGVLVGVGDAVLPVRIEVEAGAWGEARVGACRYPALTVTTRMTLGDQPVITVLRQLDPETLIVFRSVTTRPKGGGQPAIRQEFRAVRIE
ncbi:MAG: hypothetical protein KF887_14060 [Paracoccaceae bacterium]|nr:MAG: hypothetical protein KF887_14060 [Paracoccaceae bacterium]